MLNSGYIKTRCEIDKDDYRDYVKLQVKYNFTPTDSVAIIKQKVWSAFKNSLNL